MEEWNVIGYQNVDFTAPDGKVIKGIRLYLTVPADPDRGAFGDVCSTQFIPNRIAYTPMVGDRIRLSFNRYGKVQSVETC